MDYDHEKTSSASDTHGANDRLRPGFGPFGTLAFSIGTAIGWGSLVVTCSTYLVQAGVWGTILGLVTGMLVIFVITRNLRYMICRNQSAGGIYTYTRKVCGYDFGFLAAWFLLLTYMSILWANTTSVPLFVRYFLGDTFRFGYLYTIFGYKVYIGEVLLSVMAIGIMGVICAVFRKVTQIIMIVSALLFVVFVEGEDYAVRKELVEKLIAASLESKDEIGSTLAVGISDYRKGEDKSVLNVFTRADKRMYTGKTEMKRT